MSGIQIMGLPEQPMEGVRLENIRLISKAAGPRKMPPSSRRNLATGYPEPRKIGHTAGVWNFCAARP